MVLRLGKVLTITLEKVEGGEGDVFHSSVQFEKDLMPMEIDVGLFLLGNVMIAVKNTAKRMVEEAEVNHARDEILSQDLASGKIRPS